MKAVLITAFILAMAVSLSGCGQKGPLYHNAPASTGEVEGAINGKPASGREEDRTR